MSLPLLANSDPPGDVTRDDELDLREYITPDRPLGPIKSDHLTDPTLLRVLFDKENRIYYELARRPSIIVGRKGAGKTAFLHSVRLDKRYQFIVEIKTYEAFAKVVRTVQELVAGDCFVETVAEIWEAVLWAPLMLEITRMPADATDADHGAIRAYLDGAGVATQRSADQALRAMASSLMEHTRREGQPAEALIERLMFNDVSFEYARDAATRILRARKAKAIVLLDSLEDFALDREGNRRSIAGLLKAIGSLQPRSPCEVRLCLPSELWSVFQDISTNPSKDFESYLAINWHASELLRMAAHRLALYLELYEPEFYRERRIDDIDLDERARAKELFDLVFPREVRNGVGQSEETIAYIMRHTQLLPRQLFRYLNQILIHNRRLGNPAWQVHPLAVRDGIHSTERDVADEIFAAYRYSHPHAREACRHFIPHVGMRFGLGELHQVFNRHVRRALPEVDFAEFKGMLLAIGCVGCLIEVSDRYAKGRFCYTSTTEFLAGEKEEFCLHPAFAQAFNCRYRNGDGRAVYPYGSDVDGVDYRPL